MSQLAFTCNFFIFSKVPETKATIEMIFWKVESKKIHGAFFGMAAEYLVSF